MNMHFIRVFAFQERRHGFAGRALGQHVLGKLLKNEVDRNSRRVVGNKLEKIVYSYIRECIERRLSCERRCIPRKCNPRRCALRSEGTRSILLDCSASFPTTSLSCHPDLRRLPSHMITICLLPLTTGLQTCFFPL